MDAPFRIVSTDFDGTLFANGHEPAVPAELDDRLCRLQASGVVWAINTGRDLDSLSAILDGLRLRARPDYLVVVEREIHARANGHYRPCETWNRPCAQRHQELFARLEPSLPSLLRRIREQFDAILYADPYSPLCLEARSNADCDLILALIRDHFRGVPGLDIMRNDIYARLCHVAFNKGTALAEIARQRGVGARQTLAAGDHWNDLPMLDPNVARFLVAPANAIEPVREAVRRHGGFVSGQPCGWGVCEGLERWGAAAGDAAAGAGSAPARVG